MQLEGITTTPFYSYLTAVALVRLVPGLRGWWAGNTFCTDADWATLSHYLLHQYRPSPVLTPWNKSGGWLATSKSQGNAAHIEAYRHTPSPRFAALQDAVAAVDRAVAPYFDSGTFTAKQGWTNKDAKTAFVEQLRNEAPDPFLAWIDTVYSFLPNGPVAIQLTGKAGSEGSGEYSKTFGDALFEVIAPDGTPQEGADATLQAALLGESAPIRGKASPGLYDPSAGGLGRDFQGGSHLAPRPNAWSVVLALEGAIAFASRASNRLDGADPGSPSVPFGVRGSNVGYSSAAESEWVELELWLPVWERPLGKAQLEALFRAGRSRLDDRPVRDGMQFARALPQFARRLQIRRLERYGILGRASEHGNAWACWLGTVVPSRSNAHLLGRCERFVRTYNQQRLSERYFQTATGARRIADFLVDLGEAFVEIDRHPGKYGNIRLPSLERAWAQQLLAEADSPEARLAIALSTAPPSGMPRIRWSASDPVAALVAHNRSWAQRAAQDPQRSARYRSWARPDDVARFIRSQTDDGRLWALARGLRAVDTAGLSLGKPEGGPLPLGFAAIALCWHGCRLWNGCLPERDEGVPYEGQILTGLTGGRPSLAMGTALRRLRAAQMTPVVADGYDIPAADCQRWAAALAFGLSPAALGGLADRLTDRSNDATQETDGSIAAA